MTEYQDTVVGDGADNTLSGGIGNSLIYGNEGDDRVSGNEGDDLLFGWTGNDTLIGGIGADTLAGDADNDSLLGGDGNDGLYGSDGADTLIGGLGTDYLDGGAGADIYRFESWDDARNLSGAVDVIASFEDGIDKFDVSALGVESLDAFDIRLESGRTYISNGLSGSDRFEFYINGDYVSVLGAEDFIFDPPETMPGGAYIMFYVPVLGQSNATRMNYFLDDDGESGATVMEDQLSAITGESATSLFYYNSGNPVNLTEGGSTVDAEQGVDAPEDAWWYPDLGQPGEQLLDAVAVMQSQLAQLEADHEVKIAVYWNQGEDTILDISYESNPAAQQVLANRYQQATSDVFDYIQTELGGQVRFFIAQSGFIDPDGAVERGYDAAEIAAFNTGSELVRGAQEALALARDDVYVSVDPATLPTLRDDDPINEADDVWHYAPESYETIGALMAEHIAAAFGYTHLLTNTATLSEALLHDIAPINAVAPMNLSGTKGDDILLGTQHADTLNGGKNNDVIIGGAGNDLITDNHGKELVFGDAGDDTISTGFVQDTVYGGDGDDLIDAGGSDDVVYGGAGNDSIDAGGNNDYVEGNEGNDTIQGYSGRDTILGGDGDDSLFGSSDHDSLDGGAGNDVIDGGYYNDTILGGEGNDTLIGWTGDDSIDGGEGNDHITAGSGVDTVLGGTGDDYLSGFKQEDSLDGGDGNDTILGGRDNDTLIGGLGADVLRGDHGADIFCYTSRSESDSIFTDRIIDFESSIDTLALTGLGFTGIQSGAASGSILGYAYNGSATILESTSGDFMITLDGEIQIELQDLIF